MFHKNLIFEVQNFKIKDAQNFSLTNQLPYKHNLWKVIFFLLFIHKVFVIKSKKDSLNNVNVSFFLSCCDILKK